MNYKRALQPLKLLTGNNSINICAVNPARFSPLIRDFIVGISFCSKLLNLSMAKSNKKSNKEASNIFHKIMKASVKGNPKPVKKDAKKK